MNGEREGVICVDDARARTVVGCDVTMSVLLVLVMCVAVRAAGCPNGCTCREVVTCRGAPVYDLPTYTNSLVVEPQVSAGAPPDVPALLETLSQLPHLARLSLVNCAIRDLSNITFDGLRLTTLDLSRNLITELSEETFNQTELRTLDVSHNLIRIRGAPFRTLCSLEVLNLSGNAIDGIPVDSLCGLQSLLMLDISANKLTALDDDMFVSLVSLQQLNLSNNQLETLSESCFNTLQRLQQLDLSWNKITHMAPGMLQGLPSLSRLSVAGNRALGGNKHSPLLVGTGKRLQTLDASHIGLEHVPAALTHSIRTLRLAGNSIRTVQCGDLDSYPLLQLLDLTNNLLEEMEEDSLGRLEMLVILYLTDNKLHAIPRSLPDGLKILHLEFNRIEQIVSGDLLGLPRLEVLLLNDNNIKVVQEGAFSQMTSLITLDLSRNPISILPAGTLSGPTKLQLLRLSSLTVDPPAEDMCFPVPSPERLVRLDLSYSPGLARQLLADKAALSAFRELQELNLTHTDLVNLRSDLLYFLPQLRDLHITGNRLNCSELLWLALWMRVQDQPEHREVVCVSPPELYGTLVVDLQDTDMATTTTATTEKATSSTTPAMTEKNTITVSTGTQTSSTTDIHFENTINNGGPEVSLLLNTTLREKKNEMPRPTIRPSNNSKSDASAVTASENRSDSGSERTHSWSVSPAVTALTDNPDNRLSTHASNYETRTDVVTSEAIVMSQMSGATLPSMSHNNERVTEFPNHVIDNSSVNKTHNDTSDLRSNVTEASETGEMSMYSSREDERSSVVHPALVLLLTAVLAAGVVVSTVVSHVRRRRRANSRRGCHSPQDIEVNSLPAISELW